MTNTYHCVDLDNRKFGKWDQKKSINGFNDCKRLEVKTSYPIVRMAINDNYNYISIGDKLGNVFMIDIESKRIEQSAKLDYCVTCIAFVDECDEINLIVATTQKNSIYCLNYSLQTFCSKIIANMSSVHKTCVNHISISGQQMLTSSQYDRSCIWDLNTLTLVKQLTDQRLAQSLFLSIDRIIASYSNHTIYVFDSDTLQVVQTLKERQLITAQKNSFITRKIANDGYLEINTINDCNQLVAKRVKPIEDIEIDSIKQLFSFYDNKILIYLTTDGLIKCKYTDFDKNRYKKITINNEFMTGITTSGYLHVFDLRQLNEIRLRKAVNQKRKEELIDDNEEAVRKLSLTLMSKYNKLPEKYRFFIWSKLLMIPVNRGSFKRIESQSNFHNKELDNGLRQLLERHNLIDDSLRHALKRTIAQLVYWRPKLLNDIEDLSLFSFPFIKLLRRNQLLLFETLATLIDNKYFMDNKLKKESEMFELTSTLLKRECLKLYSHFNSLKVDASHYCLPLIISLFSEVFLRNDWLIVCDNLITYGPQMFIYLVVSYCHLSQQSLIRMKTIDEIDSYFRAQNSMPVNKVIQMSHSLSQKYVPLMPFFYQSIA